MSIQIRKGSQQFCKSLQDSPSIPEGRIQNLLLARDLTMCLNGGMASGLRPDGIMSATAPARVVGKPVSSGICIGRARLFDPCRLFTLHQSLTELAVVEEMQNLLGVIARVDPGEVGNSGLREPRGESARRIKPHFLEGVERALRREGGGLEFAVATVLTRYQEGVEVAPTREARGMLHALTDLAASALGALLERRGRREANGPGFIALASSLTLAEAMNLGSGVAGLAVGGGLERHVAFAARLLKTPAVWGIPGVCQFAREGDVVRLDGDLGTLETLARIGLRGD